MTHKHLHINGHAVVIGGSVAGILAARALVDFFDCVTVVERDELPDAPVERRGVPQASHAHALLVRGQHIMEEFFPGFADELVEGGARYINMARGVRFYLAGKPLRPFDSALDVLACSRPLIEHVIRCKLQESPHVRFLQGCSVEGICTDAQRTQATGIRYRQRGKADGESRSEPTELAADLIVDASGRNSQLPKWLAQLGYTPPESVTVDAKAGYASRIYRLPPEMGDGQMMYYMPEAPHQSRGGITMPIESEKGDEQLLLMTLIGLNGDYPPSDAAGFEDFARGLPAPEFSTLLAKAEPVDAPFGYRRAANRLRKYDELPRYLDGLLAIGDSVYALNPVYGQGMTVAALASQALHDVLAAHEKRRGLNDLTGLARTFQRKLTGVIADPWQLATGQDLRWPVAAAGHKTPRVARLVQRYLDAVIHTMANDAVVAEAFFHVQNMLRPPTTLFHPRVAARVWRARRNRPALDETYRRSVTVPVNVHS